MKPEIIIREATIVIEEWNKLSEEQVKTIPFELSFAIGLLHDSIYCPDGEILNLISNNNRENN